MNFIKDMISRKNHPSQGAAINDQMNQMDGSEVDDFDEVETVDQELRTTLSSIQAKLQGKKNGGAGVAGKEEPYILENEKVENFADLVAKKAPSDKSEVQAVAQEPARAATKPVPSEIPEETPRAAIDAKVETTSRQVVEPPRAELSNEDTVKPVENQQASEETVSDQQSPITDSGAMDDSPLPADKIEAMDESSDPTENHSAESAIPSEKVEQPSVENEASQQISEQAAASEPSDSSVSELVENNDPTQQVLNVVEVPAPAAGRSGRRAGRVKTRLLGFETSNNQSVDPFESSQAASAQATGRFPVGWIVVVAGPGRGASFDLSNGVCQIGRGEDQAIRLDFGDSSVSRSNHAAIAYDDEQRKFFLGHGGKANLVRLNGAPVLSTEEISTNDMIRIGETTLRFIGLCDRNFDWGDEDQEVLNNAAIA